MIRSILQISTNENEKLSWYKEALKQIEKNQKVQSSYPEEVLWLATTCWNYGEFEFYNGHSIVYLVGCHCARFHKSECVKELLNVGYSLAQHCPRLKNRLSKMQDDMKRLE